MDCDTRGERRCGAAAAALLVALCAVTACERAGGGPGADVLGDYGGVPEFRLTDQSGRPFASSELDGRVWVANFIFTRCGAICPAMTRQMSRLQDELRTHPRWSDVRLVSFSVDPEHDTPEVLARYADDAGADERQWRFLTGPREQIWQLSKDGFLLGVGEAPDNPQMPIFHSQKFVLVDGSSRIRAYYDGLADEERARLATDIDRLLR